MRQAGPRGRAPCQANLLHWVHESQFSTQPKRRKQAIPEQDAGDAAIARKKPSPEFLAKVERWKAGDASALDGMTVLQPSYRFPHDDDSEEVKPLKRLAARYGRAFGRYQKCGPDDRARFRAEIVKAYDKLLELMRTLPTDRLHYWAEIVMIDHRWCGATGTGAYWAVASEVTNRTAKLALAERKAA